MAFSFKRSKAGTADQGDASAVMTGSPDIPSLAQPPASCHYLDSWAISRLFSK
jgi:hypothetical protein